MGGLSPVHWLIVMVVCAMLLGMIVAVVVSLTVQAANLRRRSNLAPCPDCGRPVSRLAKTCPQCGRPLQS